MKRFFFSLIALSAVAVGCTQSSMLETPELGGTEISFEPYTGRTPQTKAQSIEGAGGDATKYGLADAGGFKVFGFLNKYENPSQPTTVTSTSVYMNNVLVEGTGTGNSFTWTPKTTHYWPPSSSTLSFVGYSANAAGHFVDANGNSVDPTSTGFTFQVPNDIDDQVDLLATAYQDGLSLNSDTDKVSASGQVSLYFHHLLSRVGFMVQTTTAKPVTITSLTYAGNMHTKGDLDFDAVTGEGTPTLAVSETKTSVTYKYLDYLKNQSTTISDAKTSAVRISRGSSNSNYMMIMPQTVGMDGKHTIEVKYKIGPAPAAGSADSRKEKTATIELDPDFEFIAGRSYEFILKISTSSISFVVAETDWNKETIEYPLDSQNPNPVEAISANNITATTADIVMTVRNYTEEDEVGVAYKVLNSNAWQSIELDKESIEKGKSYTLSISGLAQNTTYEYCAYVTNGGKTEYYPKESNPTFKTKVAVSFGSFDASADITSNSVTLTATAQTITGAEYGFCYILGDANPLYTDAHQSATNSNGTFTATISGLDSFTTYSFRAYVKVGNEYSYSEKLTCETDFDFGVGEDDSTGGVIQ